MISPLLWQSLSFKDETAWLDFLGQHALAHQALAGATRTRHQLLDDLREEQGPHSAMHSEVSAALGLGGAALEDADLNDEAAFYSWTQLHAMDHARLHVAAGVP